MMSLEGIDYAQELVGPIFYGEPVGRIVRQVNSENEEGLTYIPK